MLGAARAQNCNYGLVDAIGYVYWSTNNTNRGAAPCRLQVTSANGGTAQILDAANVTWNVNTRALGPAPGSGVLAPGQLLSQARHRRPAHMHACMPAGTPTGPQADRASPTGCA